MDYAGTLMDVRLRPGEDFPEDQPEAERALGIARAAGFTFPAETTGSSGCRIIPMSRIWWGRSPMSWSTPGRPRRTGVAPAASCRGRGTARRGRTPGGGDRRARRNGPDRNSRRPIRLGPGRPHGPEGTSRCPCRSRSPGYRKHRARSPRRRSGYAGGMPVLARGARDPMGPLRRAAGAPRRPERAVQTQPCHGSARSRAILACRLCSRTGRGGSGTADQRRFLAVHPAKGAHP